MRTEPPEHKLRPTSDTLLRFPLITPYTTEHTPTMKAKVGMRLAEKLLGKRDPVTLSKIACGRNVKRAIQVNCTNRTTSVERSEKFCWEVSGLLTRTSCKAFSDPLFTKQLPARVTKIIQTSNGEARLTLNMPKNHLIPALLSKDRCPKSGIAAVTSQEPTMTTTCAMASANDNP